MNLKESIMEEEVKWIKGYEGLYQITSTGRVLSVKRKDRFNRLVGGELKQSQTGRKRDYYFVNLFKDGKGKQFYVHRLVAEAFIPNPDNKPCIDHIDNNKSNNNVSNLRWVTPKENSNNEITLKRMRDMSDLFGFQDPSKNPFSRKVGKYDDNGNLLQTFGSLGQAEKETGISQNQISKVCRGERKRTGGYHWKYLSEPKLKILHSKPHNAKKRPILKLSKDDEVIEEYESVSDAARKCGINACNIIHAARGHYKSCKGYKWRYK